jgi:predicted transposase YbfD/YdcC
MRSPRLFPPQEKVKRQAEVQSAESSDKYGGRVEIRRIETLAELPPYLDFPGLKQVCRIERQRTLNGLTTQEVVCAITSLDRRKASAKRLQKIVRQHWHIENRLHYVRDVSLGEDACRVRSGSAPQLLAGLRNVVLGLIRKTGTRFIPRALQRFAAKPLEALACTLPEF